MSSNVLQFPKAHMKPLPPVAKKPPQGPGLPPQLRQDVQRFLDWWYGGPGDWDVRKARAYSVYELKGHTGIPAARLPEVLRHTLLGWVRVFDRESRVHLWTCNPHHPLVLAQRALEEEYG